MPSRTEDQIRALIDVGAPPIMLTEVDALRTRPTPASRPTHRPLVAVGIAALVVVAMVTVVAGFVLLRDGGHTQAGAPNPGSYQDLYDTSGEPANGPLYLAPEHVPDGFSLLRVDDHVAGTEGRDNPELDRVQSWARLDNQGSVVDTFTLEWGAGPPGHNDVPGDFRVSSDPLQGFQGKDATTVRGHRGFESDPNKSGGDGSWLAWEEPPGKLAMLSSPSLTTAELQQIADGLTAGSNGTFEVTTQPAGFVEVDDQPGTLTGAPSARGLIYQASGDRGIRVRIEEDSANTPGANLDDPALTPRVIDIAGRHGVAGTRVNDEGWVSANSGGGFDAETLFLEHYDQFVQWLAPGNTLVTVISTGLTGDELIDFARGLQSVDRSAWESLADAAER